MKNNKVTINDIAAALSVSSVSVSRALSGQTGVGEELKNKIIEKAKELGYEKSKKADQFNILVLHQKPYKEDNSNFSSMVQGVEKFLQNTNSDYSVEFVDNDNQKQLTLPYKLSKGIQFDGAILIGRFTLKYLSFIQGKIDNLVFFTGYYPSVDCDCIRFNFVNAGYKLCELLIKKGHTKIGFIGNSRFIRNKESILGITTALEDYKLPSKNEYFIPSEAEYSSSLIELIRTANLPSAFICEDDIKAVELMKFLTSQK